MRGENHPCWKGGVKLLRDAFYDLTEYKNWRKTIFERDDYTCQECKEKGGKLEVHHIKPLTYIHDEFLSKYNQFSLIEDRETLLRLTLTYEPFWDINNGKTLCKDCHNLTKKGKYTKNKEDYFGTYGL